jgi:hypothetical protein
MLPLPQCVTGHNEVNIYSLLQRSSGDKSSCEHTLLLENSPHTAKHRLRRSARYANTTRLYHTHVRTAHISKLSFQNRIVSAPPLKLNVRKKFDSYLDIRLTFSSQPY